MVTKRKITGQKVAKKGRVKVGKLQLNKETVKDLSGGEAKKIKGGGIPSITRALPIAVTQIFAQRLLA